MLALRPAADIIRMQIANRPALVTVRALAPLLLLLQISLPLPIQVFCWYGWSVHRLEILSLPRTAPPLGTGEGLR
jgi:hypothetical protein